jgi:hypothetical protein
LEVRGKEADYCVSLLEESEQRAKSCEEQAKAVEKLRVDCKQQVEESCMERDRLLMME